MLRPVHEVGYERVVDGPEAEAGDRQFNGKGEGPEPRCGASGRERSGTRPRAGRPPPSPADRRSPPARPGCPGPDPAGRRRTARIDTEQKRESPVFGHTPVERARFQPFKAGRLRSRATRFARETPAIDTPPRAIRIRLDGSGTDAK
jgi:hypothetical protein